MFVCVVYVYVCMLRKETDREPKRAIESQSVRQYQVRGDRRCLLSAAKLKRKQNANLKWFQMDELVIFDSMLISVFCDIIT